MQLRFESVKVAFSEGVIKRYLFAFISIAILATSITVLHGTVPYYLVAPIYFFAASVPFLSKKLGKQNVVKHLQLFYIIPLLVSTSLTYQYGASDYLLQFIILVAAALVSSSELAQTHEKFSFEKFSYYVLGVLMLCAVGLGVVLMKFPFLSKLVTLLGILALYMFTDRPGEKIAAFKDPSLYTREKILFFGLAIIFVYGFISFTGTVNFPLYLAYVVSVVNLGFLLKGNKSDFIIFVFIILLAALVPFGPKEIYIDSVIAVSVIMLFHLQTPVLYHKKTKYGEVRVDYDYVSNRLCLLVDNIIQGEKFIDKDNKSTSLMYFGNFEKTSIVSNVFKLLDNKKKHNIAVLGLGTGEISMLGKQNHKMDFYEINPEIVRLAYDKRFFDYLVHSEARTKVILGDARKQISFAEKQFYSMIVVDVYLGDIIPNHFLTLEAISMYFEKLSQDGVLVLHITSNESDQIETRLEKVASSLKLHAYIAYEQYSKGSKASNLSGLVQIPKRKSLKDRMISGIKLVTGVNFADDEDANYSSWVVISKKKASVTKLLDSDRWYSLESRSGDTLYTDEVIGYNQKGKGKITQEVF